MEKGSNFVEMLAGFRGWYGWDRSAATINSELFPLKTEAQAIRYGHFRQVFRFYFYFSCYLPFALILCSLDFLPPCCFPCWLPAPCEFCCVTCSIPDNLIGAEIKSESAENEPKQLREQPRSKQKQLRLS